LGVNVWVSDGYAYDTLRIDPVASAVTATVAVESGPQAAVFDGTNIWVANTLSDNVSKIVPF
jgi:DNA-binding beta-propeller fold protein YncE